MKCQIVKYNYAIIKQNSTDKKKKCLSNKDISKIKLLINKFVSLKITHGLEPYPPVEKEN